VTLPIELFKKYYEPNSIKIRDYLHTDIYSAPNIITYLLDEAVDNGCVDYNKNDMKAMMIQQILDDETKFDLNKYVNICQTNHPDDFVEIFVGFLSMMESRVDYVKCLSDIRHAVVNLLEPHLTPELADWIYFRNRIESILPHISDRMKTYKPFIYNFIYQRNVDDIYESIDDAGDVDSICEMVNFCSDLMDDLGRSFPKSNMRLTEIIGDKLGMFEQPMENQMAFVQRILSLMEASPELNDFINNHS